MIILLAIGLDRVACNARYYTGMHSRKKGVSAKGAGVGKAGLVCVILGVLAVVVWLWRPTGTGRTANTGALLDVDPLTRAAYCAQASDTELIVLASDTDWRVRSTAFETLSGKGAIERLPMRDTPIGEREQVVLSWIDQHRPGLSTELCSVYAQPQYVRFGGVLVDRCMTCHTGRQPEAKFSDSACVACHEPIHTAWSGTAHANSLSHLVLPTVDTTTRQPGVYDFVGRKGLSCVACHEPTEADTSAEAGACLTEFVTTSCTTCHTQTGAQWDTWTQAPRYRPSTWPPGSVERVEGEAFESCVDCHMPEGQHLWGARRDVALLRSGIVMKFEEQDSGELSLVLANLAGHAYPSGGVRRGLRLYLQVGDEPEMLVAVLADDLERRQEAGGEPPRLQPVLQPGETRAYPLSGSGEDVRARLVYVRNRFQTGGYTVEIDSLEYRQAIGE